MSSTSNTSNETHPEITFYVFGRRMPHDALTRENREELLAIAQNRFPNLVPTTYEAAKTYLDQEILKPKGQRNIPREMCMLNVINVPNDQDIVFRAEATNILISLSEGDVVFYPTIEVPPFTFGTLENRISDKLLDRKTSNPGQATILLSYFTRVGPESNARDDGTIHTRVDGSAFE